MSAVLRSFTLARHFAIVGLGVVVLALGCTSSTETSPDPGDDTGGSGGSRAGTGGSRPDGTRDGTAGTGATGGAAGSAPRVDGSVDVAQAPSKDAGAGGGSPDVRGQGGGLTTDAIAAKPTVACVQGKPLDPGGPYAPINGNTGGPPQVAVIALDFPGMLHNSMAKGGARTDLPAPHTPKVAGRVKVYSTTLQNTMASQLTGLTPGVDSTAGIGGHGNSSWVWNFKSMEFEFTDATGANVNLSIPGFPKGSDFVLWACYTDNTCLRNWLTYDLMRRMGYYAPRTLFVEGFVNGAYEGLYLLVEAVRRDNDRVNIPKAAPNAAMGDLTGGYILEFNSSHGPGTQFVSKSGQPWNYHYPRFNAVTVEQKTYLAGYVDKVEASFNTPAKDKPETSFKSLIDVRSWVDVLIFQELAFNQDAYWRSQYLYKTPDAAGGKLFLGPLWDYDFAWGLTTGRTDAWAYVHYPPMLPTGPDFKFPPMFLKAWADPELRLAVRARWEELRRSLITPEGLAARIDEGATGINAAQARNNNKWHIVGANFIPPVYMSTTRTTYQANIDYLKMWIAKRIAWMDANLAAPCP